MEPSSIRKATIADSKRIASLFDAYRQFYQQAPDLRLAQQFIEQRLSKQESSIFIAEDSTGKMIGFTQLYPSFCSVSAGSIYVLYDLFVMPDTRHHGVGRALMRAAEAFARSNGAVRMDLSTARKNEKAQGLYRSEGWVLDQEFLVFSKQL